ncbi:Immunoglobulin super DCC subclass member 3 [Desmophyllum pertusum]|uniref:Immunoglobulin super DCC subclass member 3 n=1 Tax=Desmophyllum pertusum TaxID=174260 RepID=A0A9W9ZPN5_9CNID|nr:Immunoglobulin super DCC subclass member 3 [Desmophyllum pertusum]
MSFQTSSDFPTVWDWRKDGKPLLEEDIAADRITSNAGLLLIKSATRADTGNYTCILINSAGNITSNRSEVIVQEAPRILGVLSADVSRDGIANLGCVVSSFPPCNITWKFKGKNISPSEKYEFIDSAYTLRLKTSNLIMLVFTNAPYQ